jgi:hypothetical protein
MMEISRPTMRASFVAVTLVAVTPFVSGQPAPPALDASALFDDSTLQSIRLRVNERDWQSLVEHYDQDTYYPADLEWRDAIVRNVGIRSRGSGSRNPHKPGLKVDMNRYVGGQRFLGLTEFVLDNLYQDPALIRERVSMKFFARMGLPAPREAFAALFVNDTYLGLYAVVESVDKRFLARAGLDDRGFLYDYEWQSTWWFEYLGDELEPYEARFQPETNGQAPYETLFRPIEEFVRTVNAPHIVERDIGEFLDLKAFLRHLAVEQFLAEWDGIVGDFGINNFYLYRPADSKVFRFIPWDKDNTFKAADYPIWPDGMEENVLTRQLMSVDALRDYFLQTLLECADSAAAPVGEPGADGQALQTWLQREIEVQYQQILEAVRADGRKPMSTGAFEEAVDRLRAFARERPDFVRRAVAARRR